MYTYKEVRDLIIKDNGRPIQISSKIYTDELVKWIMINIKGESSLQGKLWCIAHNLTEVPKCANELCNRYTAYHNKFKQGFRKFCGNPSCNVTHPDTIEKYKQTSIKNWGVDSPLKNLRFREMLKDSIEKVYGNRYPMQCDSIKRKYRETSKIKYGVDHPFKDKNIRDKCQETLYKNFNVNYPAQNKKIMEEIMTNRCIRTSLFNNNLYYQGSYEKYFLDKMKEYGHIEYVKNGLTFRYTYLNKERLYVSDFFIPLKNQIIEIKSKWTYNKHGNDIMLENMNLSKKDRVIEDGYNFKFLIGHKEIDTYIKNFSI